MKNASTILSHLIAKPQFSSLKRHACYRKFISLLGKKWQRAIAFVYIKNDTLFVAVKHPGFKMELHYNRDLLKSVLTQIAAIDPSCTMLRADKVVIFHSKFHPVTTQKTDTVPHYAELAEGRFPLPENDTDLQEAFARIKDQIRCNR